LSSDGTAIQNDRRLKRRDTGLAVHACNALGTLHASYIVPGAKHPDVKEHEFIWQWITFITEQRLPSALTLTSTGTQTDRPRIWLDRPGPTTPPIDGEGNPLYVELHQFITPLADFKGDPAQANWLPNDLAKGWKVNSGY